MALEKKTIRANIDPDVHAGLTALCEFDQLDIGEWVEQLVGDEVRRRIHEAHSIASKVADMGIVGNRRARSGNSLKTGQSE